VLSESFSSFVALDMLAVFVMTVSSGVPAAMKYVSVKVAVALAGSVTIVQAVAAPVLTHVKLGPET
jgi:hypothetical protein